MSTSDLHVVLGASGATGAAIVRELVDRGHRVRAVSRGESAAALNGVERLRADVATTEGARQATAGAAVIYHAAQPAYTRWAEEFPVMTDAIIAGATAASAKIVFADNLYMYGPTSQPMTESTPERATGKKGRVRILMARRLLDAHRAGQVRVALGRSSDYFGPGGVGSMAGETVFGAALAGKAVRWPGSLDVPHQLNYLPDMARALVTLGERDDADGAVWHLPASEAITARQFLGMVFEASVRPEKIAVTSRTMLRLIGLFSPFIRELGETLYQFEQPFVADTSAFQRAFGPFQPTQFAEAIPETVA